MFRASNYDDGHLWIKHDKFNISIFYDKDKIKSSTIDTGWWYSPDNFFVVVYLIYQNYRNEFNEFVDILKTNIDQELIDQALRNSDPEVVFYWITGGNAFWMSGFHHIYEDLEEELRESEIRKIPEEEIEYISIDIDELRKNLYSTYEKHIKKVLSEASIDNFKDVLNKFNNVLSDFLYEDFHGSFMEEFRRLYYKEIELIEKSLSDPLKKFRRYHQR